MWSIAVYRKANSPKPIPVLPLRPGKMKRGDLVKRKKKSEESYYDEIPVGSSCVIVRGPYEKNITDILYLEKPWLANPGIPKYMVLKRVLDLMHNNRIHECCIADDYEREK